MRKYAVIILNWNGAMDTIECVRSILKSDSAALPVIVDNGSNDNSIEKILNEFNSNENEILSGDFDVLREDANKALNSKFILLREKENLGFAAGCNLGLKLVAHWGIRVSIFLNNDTIVEPSALTNLVKRIENDPSYYVTLPLLTIYGTGLVWNCGGSISSLGYRRYFFAGAVREKSKIPQEIECSFFTGCCFAVRTMDFINRGGFCEKFFFGEEDFELSLWMKDHGLKALCLTSNVVHHKVSASISRASKKRQASKVYIHYLNRFIHMRHRMGTIYWRIWLTIYLPYITTLFLIRKVIPISEVAPFVRSLVHRAAHSNGVTRHDFELIMDKTPW